MLYAEKLTPAQLKQQLGISRERVKKYREYLAVWERSVRELQEELESRILRQPSEGWFIDDIQEGSDLLEIKRTVNPALVNPPQRTYYVLDIEEKGLILVPGARLVLDGIAMGRNERIEEDLL